MTVDILLKILGWSAVINMGLLLWWVLWFITAHDFIYRFHGKWFTLPVEKFDKIHYSGMLFFKICIFLFNITPYVALRIVT